jgi:pilus assembly protein CpaE
MIKIVIGAAEQSIAYDLRAALSEMDGVDALFVVESTDDLIAAVVRLNPDVVIVHERLGPEPALQTIRDLSMRRPDCAALVVTVNPTTELMGAAMDAGARGLIGYPPTFEDLQARVNAAGEWAQQMRRLVGASGGGGGAGSGDNARRARLVALTGAKGGVGTTTVATHLALDVVRSVDGFRVCLVDLDLEKGDVSGIVEVRHRASVADVAKVSQDLSGQAVGDAVVVHESGLHLLLAPSDVRDVEAVTPRSLREVLAVLRQEYDLVLVDAGSHVTPVQAAVVELADEVVMVTTPDVLAMRGLRRALAQWDSLAVRKESDVRVLVNRVSRQTTVSAETVRQLTRAPVLSAGLPAMYRRLEPALNARDPRAVRETAWWRTLRAIGHEIGLAERATPDREGRAAAELIGDKRPGKRGGGRSRLGRGRTAGGDTGAVAIETVGVLPILLLVVVLAWQGGIYGMSMVWAGRAASAAARAMSVREDPLRAARQAVPANIAGDLSVSTDPATATVLVSLRVPLVAPGAASLPATVKSRQRVVMEP